MIFCINKSIPINYCITLLFLIFQFFFTIVFSQIINFKYGEFELKTSYEDYLNEESNYGYLDQPNYYKVIRFISIPNKSIRNEIESMGIYFLEYISENSYIVSIPNNFLKSNLEDYNISHVQNIPKNLRFNPVIFESPIPKYADKIDKISLEIILMKNFDFNIFVDYLKAIGANIIEINTYKYC